MNATKLFLKRKDTNLEELKTEIMHIIHSNVQHLNNRISATENVLIKEMTQVKKDVFKSEKEREQRDLKWSFHVSKNINKFEKLTESHEEQIKLHERQLHHYKALIDELYEKLEELENYVESQRSASDYSDADTEVHSSDDERHKLR